MCQAIEVAVEHRLWKPEFGDGPADHSTCVGVHFEDFDGTSGQRQFRCRRHATGAGADDCDLFPHDLSTLWQRRCERVPRFIMIKSLAIHYEALDVADGQRFIQVGANTGGLAQVVANPPQGGGDRVVSPGQAQRLIKITFPHRLHVLRYLLIDRALVNAGRLDTVEQFQLAPGLAAGCEKCCFLELVLPAGLICVTS